MDMNPPGSRPDLSRLADEGIEELIAAGAVSDYTGTVPANLRRKLKQAKLSASDEYALEDLLSERMIALTKNDYVEEVTDADIDSKLIRSSYDRPVMVDIYSDYCRPCNHVLPVVYQLAAKYREQLRVVKINAARNRQFAKAFLGRVHTTPSFLFFKDGKPVNTGSGLIARLVGVYVHASSNRVGLERRIAAVLRSAAI